MAVSVNGLPGRGRPFAVTLFALLPFSNIQWQCLRTLRAIYAQSQYKNVLLEPTGGQGVVLIDLFVRLPISLHSFYEHLSMSATVEATTPTPLSTLANIVPTDGVQAQIAESATGGLDLALNDKAMATKLKVGLAIIPGERSHSVRILVCRYLLPHLALFVFLIVSFCLAGRVRPKGTRAHILPCSTPDILPLRRRPSPRIQAGDSISSATVVGTPRFDVDALVQPLPAAHV